MKKILLLLLLTLTLYAKSKESCYTVQLISVRNTQENFHLLDGKSYPKECKLMQIGRALTLRCGCYDAYKDAKQLRKKLSSYKKAVIATTYKYRFSDSLAKRPTLKAQKGVQRHRESSTKSEEEELRLILQVFLYKGDLKNAYKVASLGYKKYPYSYYWNLKMANICKWTNRTARAMKYLKFIYDFNRDPKIEKELVDYSIAASQYEKIAPLVIDRAIADPTEKNIDVMIYVLKHAGSPQKALTILDTEYNKERSKSMLLTKALQLSLELGSLDMAKKYVTIVEANRPYSIKDAALIARYYYIKHKIEKSYESLYGSERRESDKKKDIIEYYKLLSDLGWYLQKTQAAAVASKKLMQMHQARLDDYERISFVYQTRDPKLAQEAVREAYKKYKNAYLFYSYANLAMHSKNFIALQELMQEIEATPSPLLQDALFWITKAKLYAHLHALDKEKSALERAETLDKKSLRIKLELLEFYSKLHNKRAMQNMVTEIAERDALSLRDYLALASAYYEMHDINRASYYTQKLLALHSPITKKLPFLFLQAYIYQAQNNAPAFMSSMRKILHILKMEAKKNPKLKKENSYLSNYLRCAINLLSPDKFEKKLQEAKKYLSEKNYNEISYSWAIKQSAYDKSLKIYHTIQTKELWMRFSNALLFHNHSTTEDMLNIYLDALALGDAAMASKQDGQIALAQTLSFEALRHNERNQNAYIAHQNISQKRSNLFEAKTSYYNRDPLLQKYIKLKNKSYLEDGYSLLTALGYYRNRSVDKRILFHVPDKNIVANIGLKKLYDRGSIEANIAYHKRMKSYVAYALDARYKISRAFLGHLQVEKNGDAQESTQLLLGGKKDMVAVDVTWNILNATSLNLLHALSSYNSQDGLYLGRSDYSRIALTKQLHQGYPDLQVGAFYDASSARETKGSRGCINALEPSLAPVIPANYYNVGVHLSYGVANRAINRRAWRPFFSLASSYNSQTNGYTYSANAGLGGVAWHQDHLVIESSYTSSVDGIGGSAFELFLKYQFIYKGK